MKTMIGRAGLVLAALLLLAVAPPAEGQARRFGWQVRYDDAQGTEAVRIREALRQSRMLERVAWGLDRWVRMPRTVTIRPTECAASDVRWVPAEASLQLCYRLLVRLSGVMDADSTRPAGGGALYYLLLHAASHVIVDELDLPAPNGEERAADEVMALMLLAQGGQRGADMLQAARTLQRADAGWDQWEHARNHRFTPERLETVACLAYGANPRAFPEYRDRGLIPAARVSGCAAAYQRVYNGLGRRLERRMN